MSQVLFRIFHSSCWTSNLTVSKQWFSNFFSSWDTLLQVYFFGGALYHPDYPFLHSCALLSPSLVPAPSCKLPWSLCLTPLVIFRLRSLWLSALVTASSWEAPVLALHVMILLWDWKAGGGGLECGVGSAEGGRAGWGWRVLSVDHHVGLVAFGGPQAQFENH